MDGVIIDSTAAHVDAWREYLKQHGLEVPVSAHGMLGRHNDDLVRDFFSGQDLTSGQIFDHGARKEALYRQIIQPGLGGLLVPGIAAFIERHRGIPMAVASNAEPANIDFVLDMAGIRDRFQIVVNGHDVKRPKPFPDIFLRAAELLAVPAPQCLVFEDSLTGVAAARAAGMRVVGLLTTLPQFDNVDLVIRDFRELSGEDWFRPLMEGVYPAAQS
jgi:HAD superfamily hydrolase (TIGR01509 family)